jgi:hypothetical protein
MVSDESPDASLSSADGNRLAAFRGAGSLADLHSLVDAADEHEAYLVARTEWRSLRRRELGPLPAVGGVPGSRVVVDGTPFWVHGVTHADTGAERRVLREGLLPALDGGTLYCEQGIRPMYFADAPAVCEMDDLRWAMARCREEGLDSHVEGFAERGLDGVLSDLGSLAATFREVAFHLVETGGDLYGERFEAALGDVASGFLTDHADLATGREFEAFRRSRAAADDPTRLAALQRYYETTFLPQPLEREWLRRHDPELELVTHARNERMADYAVAHHTSASSVHLVVGAAHQPGVRYYLERHRDGERHASGFEVV